jgi:hypothetical protein
VTSPPSRIASDVSSTPGASLRQRSAAASAIDTLTKEAKAQGLKVNVPKNLLSGGK